MKTGRQVEGSKRRRSKKAAATSKKRATFIGTRPRVLSLTLRGEVVEVEVIPAIGTMTHVNFEITIRRRGRIVHWVLTPAELESIGRAAGLQARQETRH